MLKNKKILIFSVDFEPTTDEVIDWIGYYGRDFDRINWDNEETIKFNFDIEADKLIVNGQDIDDYESIWFRKGWSYPQKIFDIDPIAERKNQDIQELKNSVNNFICKSKVFKLGKFSDNNIDKIECITNCLLFRRRANKFARY